MKKNTIENEYSDKINQIYIEILCNIIRKVIVFYNSPKFGYKEH